MGLDQINRRAMGANGDSIRIQKEKRIAARTESYIQVRFRGEISLECCCRAPLSPAETREKRSLRLRKSSTICPLLARRSAWNVLLRANPIRLRTSRNSAASRYRISEFGVRYKTVSTLLSALKIPRDDLNAHFQALRMPFDARERRIP